MKKTSLLIYGGLILFNVQAKPMSETQIPGINLISLGELTITSYRSVKNQCDSSPFFTSIGEHVHSGGVALSRDLLSRWGGPVHYGDTLYVEGLGLVHVNDCMHERMKKHIDVWVKSYEHERAFQKRWKSRKIRVYKVEVVNHV